MRRQVEALAALALTLALAGCGGDAVPPGQQETFCFSVGASHSAIVVDGARFLAQHPHIPLNLYTCIDGRCTGSHYRVGHRIATVGGMSGFHVDASRRTEVHFTAVSRGKTVFDGRTTVRLHRGYPNGKGCPPITWFAQVSVSGQSTLRQDNVTYDELYTR
jgi:hypothetical protein